MAVPDIRNIAYNAMPASKYRLQFAFAAVIFYFCLCYILGAYTRFTALPILSVIPLVIIAWLYGARIGIIAGLLSFPVNAFMLTIIGIDWFDTLITTGGQLLGSVSLVAIGFIVGRLSDLSSRLKYELRIREAVEQELRLHRENLEQLVNDKILDLQESQERFRAIAENSPDAIIISDVFGVILYCNKRAEELFGYSRDEMLGKNSTMFLPEEKREAEQFRRNAIARSGMHAAITATIESEMVRKDGSEFPVEFSLYSWSLEGDLFYSMTVRDITQRRKAEASMNAAADALQRSRDFFQNVFDCSADGIYITDEMGSITFANKALSDMLGYDQRELIGMDAVALSATDAITPRDDKEEQELILRDYSTPFETIFERKDGSILPVEARVTNVTGDSLAGPGIVVTLRDITERKQAEEEIRKARDFLETTFKTSPDAIIVTDPEGYISAANESVYDVYGYRPEELIGQHASILPTEDEESMQRSVELVEQIHEHGIVRNFEVTRKHKNGYSIYVETSAALLKNPDGTSAGSVSAARDITERKKSEEQIRSARDFLETTFKTSPDAIIVVDGEGYITTANDSVYEVYGYHPQELIGQHASILAHDDEESSIQNLLLIEEVFEKGIVRNFETTRINKVGLRLKVETSIALLKSPDGTVVGSISSTRDISERKGLEEELQRSRDYLEMIFMASPDAIMVCNDDGTIIMANDSVYDVYGYRPEELIGEHGSIFTPHNQNGYVEAKEALEGLFEHGILRGFVNERQCKDGHTIWAESSHVLLKEPDGTLVGTVSSSRDITDRRRMEDQLRQAQKMEAIGTLAGGIAHDFNNILGAIIGYAELSHQDEACSPQIKNNLDQILNAGERARNLVKQILAFSRKSQSDVKPLQVHLILKEGLKLMRASLPANIEIKADMTDNRDVVHADATQLHQVLVNLCTNAAHAMEQHGGVMAIDLKPVELQAVDMETYSDLQPGPYLQLTVSDTGAGIGPEHIGRIFEPFFTTKDVGKGTGMGLAVVHGIIKSLKGDIKVYSEPGRGTVFHVLLPRVDEEVADGATLAPAPPRGHESVLLVDDEASLLYVGANMLRSLGYQVTAIQRPLEALELFKSDPDAFDLVFTDQAMPDLSGFELAKQVLRVRPDMPVLLCTGYSDQVDEEVALAAGISAYLIKPLSRLKIGETIHRVMKGLRPD